MEGKEIVTLTSCVEVYLRARRLDGYSDKTLYSYKLHLRRLALDLGADTAIDAIKLEHEIFEVLKQTALQVALDGYVVEAQEVEVVRVFQHLLREFGLRSGQCSIEIRECRALPFIQFGFDLGFEHGSAPAVLYGGAGVPLTQLGLFNLL